MRFSKLEIRNNSSRFAKFSNLVNLLWKPFTLINGERSFQTINENWRMIEALNIENFKLFKQLKIPTLKRVNLIAGKNNVGKTALLEAFRIRLSEADPSVIHNIIFERGDWEKGRALESFSSLFYGKNYRNLLLIGNFEFTLLDKSDGYLEDFRIRKIKKTKPSYPNTGGVFRVLDNGKKIETNEDLIGNSRDFANFIPASKIDNAKLWSNILLSKKEEMMTEMMQSIIPEVVRVSVKPDTNEPIVRLKDADLPVPLKNFGHGANRFFSIALAFVNSEKKYLMIDEIENGLHHSVLEEIWENVFKMAKKLDVQVFATTHSEACISAFSYVLQQEEFKSEGCYFRISKEKEGVFKPVYYNQEELELALSGNIEIR